MATKPTRVNKVQYIITTIVTQAAAVILYMMFGFSLGEPTTANILVTFSSLVLFFGAPFFALIIARSEN